MKTPQETKMDLRNIRASLDAALAEVAKKHGLQKLNSAACTFDPHGAFKFSVEGVFAGGLSKEATMYNACRHFENLPPLGTKFALRGESDEIVGMNTTGTKVLTTRVSDGKQYWWKVDVLKNILARQSVAAPVSA